ncbi:MAG: GAF domain-containing protein [Anaerolineae bacterium]|jgi:signal transduction histidine kinase
MAEKASPHQRPEVAHDAVSRLKTINEVTTALTQSFNLEQTLDDILDRVLEVLGVGAGAIYLLDEERQGLTLVAHRNLPPEVIDEPSGTRSARMLARHEDLQCKLAGPLRAKGEINGLLFVGDPRSCPILRQEEELLNTVCNTMGVFVENVRLYHELTRQLAIERSVIKVTKQVTSELELDRVLPKVMQIAVDLAGADGGVIALLDEERNVIRYPYLHHLPPELADVTVSKGEGLSGQVMITGEPMVIDNYETYRKAIPAFVEAGLTSVANVPIVSGERTFGALSVLSINEAKAFSEREMAILTAIGRQAGIAIENAYLYGNLRFYARQITQAQESERRRIARELHDDTIQSLVALSRRLEVLATSDDFLSEEATERVAELQEAAGEMIRRVRRFSQDLRPSILDDLGLLPTLEELTADLNRQDGLHVEFSVEGEERRLSSEVELTLFRIAQEALNNVRKHADATRLVITVGLTDSGVTMTVEDNGRGFNPPTLMDHPAAAGNLGLIGMHERARLLGGSLTVDSERGRGTRVVVNVPA